MSFKRNSYLLVLLLFGCCAFGQYYSIPRFPGTVKSKDSSAVKAREVTVEEYLEFIVRNNVDTYLFPIKNILVQLPYQQLFEEIRKAPDAQSLLSTKNKYFDGRHFFKINGSKEDKKKIRGWLSLPISGISFLQADKYCKWLEQMYNQI